MSPLHINMTNVFHTGRPRGSLTTTTSVTNSARPISASRSLSDLFARLKRMLAKYAGFVGPGILISIAYMVTRACYDFNESNDCRIREIIQQMFQQAHNSSINSSASFLHPTSLLVSCSPWHANSAVSQAKTLLRIVANISPIGFGGLSTFFRNWQ